MAENRFLQLPTGPAAVATDAPPLPEIKTLPARGPSAAASLSGGLLPPPDLQPLFEKYSAEYGVPINVLSALAQQESNYNANAVGVPTKWGTAKGMLQNLDANAKHLGIDPFNAEQAIAGAARQMRERLDKGDSMEDVVKAHFGGDNRKQWGEKTNAYGQEVMAKASIIGSELMANKPAAAQDDDLAKLQADLDAKEPGRYKIIDPADIAARDQQRADIASGQGALKSAQDAAGAYDAPSPLTLDNQQRMEQASQLPLPVSNAMREQAAKDRAATRDRITGTGQPTLEPWEPTLGERIAGLIPGNKDRAAVELAAREGAAEKGVTTEDIYAQAGGYRQAFNPEGRAPLLATGEALSTLAPQAADIGPAAVNTVLRSLRGGDMGGDRDWLDKAIKATDIDKPAKDDPNYEAFQGVGQSLAYSLVSMAAGITTGAIGSLAGPVAGAGAGMAGSGAVSYRASRDQFLDQVRDSLSAKTQQLYGRQMTDGEWQAVAKDYDTAATKYGAWEAIPEAVSNLIIVKSLSRPLSSYKGASKLGEIAKRAAEAQATEQSTELATGIGQNRAQVDAGLAQEQSAAQILRQQGLNVALTTGLMAGGGSAARAAYDRTPMAKRRAEEQAVQDDINQSLQSWDGDLSNAPVAPAAQQAVPEPAPAAAPAPSGPLTRAAQQYVEPAPAVEQAPVAEPVIVRSTDGEMAGTLQSYEEDGQGGWRARVLADDGNAYDFTQDDGVQLVRQGQAAQADEVPTLTDAVEPQAAPVAEPAPEGETRRHELLSDRLQREAVQGLDGLSEPQLRDELKAIAQQIKAYPLDKDSKDSRNGLSVLRKRRTAIEQAIKVAPAVPATPAEPAAPVAADLAGAPIDAEWSRFADDSGSLNIPRADMPQIKAEHRGAMTQFLGARGITHTQEEVPADSLKPTQAEFSPGKVAKAIGFEGGDRSILISSDNHVLDGHHQWLAKRQSGEPVKVIRLDAPIKQLLETVREFPSAEQADGATAATPETKAPSPKAPAKKPLTDTRGTGERFHGSSTPLPEGGPTNDGVYAGSASNIYGQGFYTTDAVDIAGGYTKKGKGGDPTLYSITEKAPVKLYDMDQPMPDNVRAMVANVLGDYMPTESVEGDTDINTLSGVYDEFRANSAGEGLSKSDVQGYFDSIRDNLEGLGYRGLTHVGGKKTGNQAHAVNIYWMPEDDLTVTRGSLDEYRGERETKPAKGASKQAEPASKAPKSETLEAPAAPADTAADLAQAAEYGANNKLVSQDRAAELRARLKAKLNGSQLNSGIDPEILALGTELAVFHIEAGVRKFADFAKTMAADLDMPLAKVRPYLRSWFNGARDMMEDAGHAVDDMDNADTVRAELANLDKPVEPEPSAKSLQYETDAVREAVHRTGKDTLKDVHAAIKQAGWPKVTDDEARSILAALDTPAERKSRELNDQANDEYRKGFNITHNDNGLRMRDNDPLSPDEQLKAAEHFAEASRLDAESLRARGEEPGQIRLDNYEKQLRELEERRERMKASAPTEQAAETKAADQEKAEPAPTAQTVTTPSGREFEVRPKVVEAKSLVTSNNADGSVNPFYPKALQPRDRNRLASLTQINDIAANLNPRLLGDSASVTDGAPIVSPDGVVESGNGRTLAIRQAYARDTEAAKKYRAWLEKQGHDVAGMEAPVLVRERITPMSQEDLAAYTTEANERTTLALSSTERAVADGKQMADILHLYRGGDISGAANREFVRAFMRDVASQSDRGSLMDGDGLLSQDGRRRIEAALLAAAYDDATLVGDIFESGESDIKAIGGALLDVAGEWAQMRQEAHDGKISTSIDATPNLMEAVNLVRQARATGKSIRELVNQNDIFSGQLDQATKDWVSVFYRGSTLARARGRDKVADALLTYTQLARATQPGDNLFGDPQATSADLLRGTHDKLDRQEGQAGQQQGLFTNPGADDAGAGARGADGQRPAPGARSETPAEGGAVNAPSPRERVEPDRADRAATESVDETAVPDEPAAAGQRAGRPGESTGGDRADGQRNQRVPADGAIAGRESGDQQPHQSDGQFQPTGGTAGGAESGRGGSDRQQGHAVERERAERIADTAPAADAAEFAERLAAQKKAAGTKTVRGDKANIDAALPLLLEPQRDDVLKAEQRFAEDNGMLLTNGTGTGKTASGMGVVLRSINDGKPNAVVVVPSDKVASDWVNFAKMLGIDLKMLESTRDNGGTGPVVTTYANFGANDSLALRDWDQVVADESHYLSSNEAGDDTAALTKLRALTGHPDGFYTWVRERNPDAWAPYQAAMHASRDAAVPGAETSQETRDALDKEEAKQRKAWLAVEEPARKAWEQRWARQQDLPKTLFLSATPFAYVKNINYAEGYLFHYVPPAERFDPRRAADGAGYNSGDARQQFIMQHFGYRMRYNKLTAPEAGVDSELMEQNFNQYLKDTGALSGRRLEVAHDYDRKFAVVDDAVGQKIDQGLEYLREHADGKYREVYSAVMDTFDYQKRMYLLEAIKARAVVPMIKAHMALGRKVVVFHDYNKGGGFDPFKEGLASISDADVKALARQAFNERPDIFKKMDLSGLFSPIDTLSAAFPDALFFNGTVSKKDRRANADAFNDDASGKDLIVLQSDAGREGVSLHDTSGKHMRVLINLGMPGKPVAAIQIEGRTYRTGQASDAAFRYLTTGTAWEASAFARKIAERASTAENLALGGEARGLKQAFIDAYNDAGEQAPSAEDGKGGKAMDRELAAQSALTPFGKAKAYYFAKQKNSKRRDQREGVDYFATAEPVGFKMAEWAGIQQGDDVLEPSAGHGAIARFFPPHSNVTMVEPSYDLSQRAALANGNARIVNDRFEALHLTNKYDAIVMNPPYGSGGKTAIEHLAKAAKHLREGGRVVALIPRGGLSDKRLETFLGSPDAESLHLVADVNLPGVAFERAGTAVNTHIVVLEKHSNPDDAANIHARTIDLSNAESTAELFDRIEHLELPDRAPTSKPEPKVELIEHITGKGKTLRGIVRTDVTKAEAQEIDPYTFPKNGGWFIRAKHLGDGSRLSVAAIRAEPATHDEVREAITQGPFGPVVQKLIDKGHIVIHGNVQTLPDGVLQVFGTQAVTAPNGTVHLIAANLSPSTANGVLLHEMFHSGGEVLVGSQRWAELMGRLDGLQRQAERSTGKARAVFDRARERVQQAQEEGGVGEGMTAEEFGAYAIEEYENLPKAFRSWVDDLVGAIKHWLFSRYGKQLGQVTPAQLRAMAKDALVSMALAKRGELFGPAGTMFSIKPSKVFTDLTDKQKSFLDKIGPEKLPQRLADRWRQLTDNLGLRIRQAGVDRYASLLRNDRALYGDDTLDGSIASSAWVLARMSPAAGGAVNALLNNGRIYLDDQQKVIDIRDNTSGLGATLRKLGNPAEIDRFMGWIAANRSKRLLGEGRENLFTPDEIEAGIKLSAGKLLDGKPRGILYQQTWKEFQQHRDDVLGIAEATGIITPEQRATWSDEFYVPFYRVMDDEHMGGPRAGSGLSRQQAYKKLKGGKQHLNDLLENTLLNFHHLLQASLKNQAAAQAMANAEQLGIASKTTESRRDKKASTFVMEGGEKQWYNVSDPLTFKAVSALADTGMNSTAMRVMRGFKRFFTKMTTITPQFVVANAIRDTLSAMATSPTSAVPLKTVFKGALTYGNNHQKARMMASGGAFSFGHVYGQGAHETKVALTGTMRHAQVLRDPKLIPNTLLNAWRKYHDITDFAENMNRAGIWEQNQGKGKLKAAFEARDLMDFSAHGDAAAIRFLIDVVPFLNARIQGLDKLYRAGVKPSLLTMFGKGSASDKQSFARFAAVIGALTAFSVMLYLRNKDDEDYRKLEDWQRDTYWVIKVGENMFFIPKPFEVGSIATMGERLMEQFTDPTVGGDKLANRSLHMLMDTFSMNPIPQAFKPTLELAMNENTFTGRPIEDLSMSRLSPSLRARPDTTRLAEASSRGIESALDLVGAGNSALSPVQIDHLIQGYLGAVGTTAIGTADTLWRRAHGEQTPARSWDEYQPVKRFYKDLTKEDNYTRYGTDFYAALKKSDQAYADLQHLAKYGEEEKAVALEQDKGDVLALRRTLNQVNRDMARVNAEMKRVQMDKAMDGKTKRMELDRLRSMRNLMTEEIGKELEQQRVIKRASAPQ